MAQVEGIVEQTLVKKSLDRNIGTITLDNSSKHNALGAALIEELLVALSDLTNAGARAMVLRAYKGAKVWSAGHDARELPTKGRDPLTYDDPLRRVVHVIKESPTPIIAMVGDGVWGGALLSGYELRHRDRRRRNHLRDHAGKAGRPLRYRGQIELHAVGMFTGHQGNAVYSPADGG